MLASLFYEDWELPVTEDGWIMIDRNGEIFQYILGYLRGSLFLPNDRNKLDLLTDEASYFGLRGLLAEIADHDLNSRELILFFSEECQFTLRIDEVRRERHSLLATIAEHVASVVQPNNRVLCLSWADGRNSDNATDTLNAFRNFEMDLVVPDGPFDDVQFPRIMTPLLSGSDQPARSLQARAYVLKCALHTLVDYLRTGELKIPTSMKTLRELVNNDFVEMNADLTWNDVQKVFSERDYLQTILIPIVVSVAKYFNLQKLKRLAENNLSDLVSLV
uniref:Potassium channel tetramerisation-type BTB domain-containing protein n=1 Tax=Plectus sambesii TaxID=2011161 RepID=A0A914W966_9BILA